MRVNTVFSIGSDRGFTVKHERQYPKMRYVKAGITYTILYGMMYCRDTY